MIEVSREEVEQIITENKIGANLLIDRALEIMQTPVYKTIVADQEFIVAISTLQVGMDDKTSAEFLQCIVAIVLARLES